MVLWDGAKLTTIADQIAKFNALKRRFLLSPEAKLAIHHFIDPFETKAWWEYQVQVTTQEIKDRPMKINLKLPNVTQKKPEQKPNPEFAQAFAKAQETKNVAQSTEETQKNVLKNFGAPSTPQKPQFKVSLRGTGFTKKLGAKAATDQKQALKRAEQAIEKVEKAEEKKPGIVIPQKPLLEVIDDVTADSEYYTKKAKQISLDETQQFALKGMLEQKFSSLIGAAGTGKSTISYHYINEMIEMWERLNPERGRPTIRACSFTGQSTRTLAVHLPEWMRGNCQTIHMTLGYHPESFDVVDQNTGEERTTIRFVPTYTAQNKLPCDIMLVDEAGNVPVWLWNKLYEALMPHCLIVQIGDINQLPPVQGRSILGYAMQQWPTFQLQRIHRQAEGNPIISNAHRVLKGQKPIADKSSFLMVKMPDSGAECFQNMIYIIERLARQKNLDPFRDAFIVPQNKGTIGQIDFNHRLIGLFNPPVEVEGAIVNPRVMISYAERHKAYAVGDKIMLLENLNELGLTNGMTGKITAITQNGKYTSWKNPNHFHAHKAQNVDVNAIASMLDNLSKVDLSDVGTKSHEEAQDRKQRQASHIVRCLIEGEEVSFGTVGEIEAITHAYAQTCHKSQGKEYPMVIILCHSSNAVMLSREWLYTAITRAQKQVVLCYNDYGIKMALGRQRIKGNTLEEKAQSFLVESSTKEDLKPILPKAQRFGDPNASFGNKENNDRSWLYETHRVPFQVRQQLIDERPF